MRISWKRPKRCSVLLLQSDGMDHRMAGVPRQLFAGMIALSLLPNSACLQSPPQLTARVTPGQAVVFFTFLSFYITLLNHNRLLHHNPFRFAYPCSTSWVLKMSPRAIAMIPQSCLHNLSKAFHIRCNNLWRLPAPQVSYLSQELTRSHQRRRTTLWELRTARRRRDQQVYLGSVKKTALKRTADMGSRIGTA